MALNLVMLGPPGAGKGTQAARLARTWSIPHISTGAMLRDAVRSDSPLGREVKAVMESGGLIDDDVVTRIVCERLMQPDAAAGFLLDGFPRTVTQAATLDDVVADRSPLVVVEVALSAEDVLRRLAARMICAECGSNAQDDRDFSTCHDCGGQLVPRADDREAVVQNRLDVYQRQTAPLVEFYGTRTTFCRVDGAQFVDRVTADILQVVGAVRARLSERSS
jgi:adenylate kinase